MIQFREPREEFARSWMARQPERKRIDEVVRGELEAAVLREEKRERPHAAQSVEVLVDDMDRAIHYRRWFAGTVSVALTAELLWAARSGGIYKPPVKADRSTWADWRYHHEPLLALRNACFHPAHVCHVGQAIPPMLRLIEQIRTDDRDLAGQMHGVWPLLRGQHVLAWGIRKLDGAGRMKLGLLR